MSSTKLLSAFINHNHLFQELVENEAIKLTSKKNNATLVLKLADGHFDSGSWWPNSCRDADFCHQQLLGAVGGKEFSCLESNSEGRTWKDFIIDALPQKLKKKGSKSEKYKQV